MFGVGLVDDVFVEFGDDFFGSYIYGGDFFVVMIYWRNR